MYLFSSIRLVLAGFVLLSLTSLAAADGPRKHQASRKPAINRPMASRTESVNNNESFRKRIDKASPAKQTNLSGTTALSNVKPPVSNKPASGIIAILIGL